jgi:hypothetical protein
LKRYKQTNTSSAISYSDALKPRKYCDGGLHRIRLDTLIEGLKTTSRITLFRENFCLRLAYNAKLERAGRGGI